MTAYRRCRIPGGTYFFTLVTHERRPLLASPESVRLLREALRRVAQDRPFTVAAMVVLPDHLHTVWTLPAGDSDYSTRWQLVKYRFSLAAATDCPVSRSLGRRREKGVWQRRFWEHLIRDEFDLRRHLDYIHFNPVKHGLVSRPADWAFSSFGRFVAQGHYDASWGSGEVPGTLVDLERE